jgi:hypothetical protein
MQIIVKLDLWFCIFLATFAYFAVHRLSCGRFASQFKEQLKRELDSYAGLSFYFGV